MKVAYKPPETISQPYVGHVQRREAAVLFFHADIGYPPGKRSLTDIDTLLQPDFRQGLPPHRTVHWPLATTAATNPARALVPGNLQG